MKNTIKIFTLGILAAMFACEDPELPKPVPATEPSTYKANFLFINATPDAPALDLYVNNDMVGTSVTAGTAQAAYEEVSITSNAVIANTNIRTKAAIGTIGGVLGSNDLIYRAGNNNANNFTASNGLSYTVIAVDSINRPAPVRTFRKDLVTGLSFGDITYYSSRASFTAPKKVGGGDTTIVLSIGSNNSIDLINTVKKYNGNAIPSFIVPIGIVPLGSSDVGGIRYYVLRDFFATFANATDSTTKAGFRAINASPSTGALTIRLKFVSGTGSNIALNGTGGAYALSNAGGFTPSVGSNTPSVTAANFTAQTIAPAGVPNVYDIEVLDAGANVVASKTGVTFGGSANQASNYSIVVSGLVGGTGAKALKVILVEHN